MRHGCRMAAIVCAGGLASALSAAGFPTSGAGEIRWHIDGEARGFFQTSDRDYDDAFGFPGASAEATGSLRTEGVEAVLDASGWAGARMRRDREILRQAYLRFDSPFWDLCVGKQIIKWGRADVLNPSDNLNHFNRDAPETDRDRMRRGDYAVRARGYLGRATLEGVIAPYFIGSVFPTPGGIPVERIPPPEGGRVWSGAVKADFQGRDQDFSASYFKGLDATPYLVLEGRPTLTYPRMQVWAADFAWPTGLVAFRGEAGWFDYGSGSGKRDRIVAVAGGEREWTDGLSTYLQLFYIRLLPAGASVPTTAVPAVIGVRQTQDILNGQADLNTLGAGAKATRTFLRDDLELECQGILNFTRGDSMIGPGLKYRLGDHWNAAAGGEFFFGKEASLFGQWKKNNDIRIELKYLI